MPLPYVISANITRQDARDLIVQLADDEEFREQFQQNAQQILHDKGIEVTPQSLPEEIILPPPEAIHDFLTMIEERIVEESASPFALALLILAFAAMPVVIGDRPPPDGAG
jgi:hypothetical protein